MELKRLFTKRLMAVLREDYWDTSVSDRLKRLKAIMPTKVSSRDYRYESLED